MRGEVGLEARGEVGRRRRGARLARETLLEPRVEPFLGRLVGARRLRFGRRLARPAERGQVGLETRGEIGGGGDPLPFRGQQPLDLGDRRAPLHAPASSASAKSSSARLILFRTAASVIPSTAAISSSRASAQ